MIPCWQAAFLTHYMNGKIIAGNQVTFNGYIDVKDNEILVLGTIVIGGRQISLQKSGVQLDVPYSLSLGLTGKKLRDVISIPETGEKEIDKGYDASTITGIRTEGDKIWIVIEGPKIDYAIAY